ncbi:MAG: hypothetical protein V7606_899 [Burkholderiales bacterium]
MKPVNETAGEATATSTLLNVGVKDVEGGGAAAPTQHAAQALQYDVLWTCLEFGESSATLAAVSMSAAEFMSAMSC